MHTIELIAPDGSTRNRTLPSSWQECSVAQLGAIAAITSTAPVAEATPEQREYFEAHQRLSLFRELVGLIAAEFDQVEVSDLLGLRKDELGIGSAALLPWVDWAMEPPAFHQSLLPHVVLRKNRWQGPKDKLSGWTITQWNFADALLRKLGSTGNDTDLHHFLAALYHPAGTVWHNEHIEQWAAQLAKMDDRTKLAAVLNYQGLRSWFVSKYKSAFKGGAEDPHGFRGMLVRLAGPKFGTTQEVEAADLHNVMVYVEQSIADAKEAENRSN